MPLQTTTCSKHLRTLWAGNRFLMYLELIPWLHWLKLKLQLLFTFLMWSFRLFSLVNIFEHKWHFLMSLESEWTLLIWSFKNLNSNPHFMQRPPRLMVTILEYNYWIHRICHVLCFSIYLQRPVIIKCRGHLFCVPLHLLIRVKF